MLRSGGAFRSSEGGLKPGGIKAEIILAGPKGEKQLAGYLVASGLDTADIRAMLSAKLPDHMIHFDCSLWRPYRWTSMARLTARRCPTRSSPRTRRQPFNLSDIMPYRTVRNISAYLYARINPEPGTDIAFAQPLQKIGRDTERAPISDDLLEMYLGRPVEQGAKEITFEKPLHP